MLDQQQFSEPGEGSDASGESLVVHRRPGVVRNRAIVILMHGLGGSRYGRNSTWGDIPRFLFEDLPDIDLGLIQYKTLASRARFWLSVELPTEARVCSDIVQELVEHIGYESIVLVGHSMGGLLAKATIKDLLEANRHSVLQRISGLLLLATPQAGSQRVPRILRRFSRDMRALAPHGSFVTALTETFVNHVAFSRETTGPNQTTIPTWALLGASDFWVDRLSAGLALPRSRQRTIHGTHTRIVKPGSKNSDGYKTVLKWIRTSLDEISLAGVALEPGQQLRVSEVQDHTEEADRRLAEADALIERELPARAALEYQAAYVLYGTSDNELGAARAQLGMAEIARQFCRYSDARAAYRGALQTFESHEEDCFRARALLGLGELFRFKGDRDQAVEAFDDATHLFRSCGDRLGLARAELRQAELMRLENPAEALQIYESCLSKFKEFNYGQGVVNTLRGIADTQRILRDYAEARACYGEAIEHARELRYRRGESAAHRGLGDLARAQGLYDEARSEYEQALRLARAAEHSLAEAHALDSIASLEFHRGSFRAARELFWSAKALYDRMDHVAGKANVLFGLAKINLKRGPVQEAVNRFREAALLYDQVRIPLGRANVLFELGEVELLAGRFLEARRNFEEAREIYQSLGDSVSVEYTRCGVARTLLIEGSFEEAEKLLLGARRVLDEKSVTSDGIEVRLDLIECSFLRCDHDQCAQLLAATVDQFDAEENPDLRAAVDLAMGRGEWLCGDRREAESSYQSAVAWARRRGDKAREARALLELGLLRRKSSGRAGRETLLEASLAYRQLGLDDFANQVWAAGSKSESRSWCPPGWSSNLARILGIVEAS